MKKSYPTLLINACLLMAGILFLMFYNNENVFIIIATILGIVFMIPSLLFLGMVTFKKDKQRRGTELMGIFPAVGGLCFGVVLCLKPELFTKVLGIIFSILLIAMGTFHLIFMASTTKQLKFKPWHYIAPVLIAAAGIVTLLIASDNTQLLTLLTGTSFILAAFSALIEFLAERRAGKLTQNSPATTSTPSL